MMKKILVIDDDDNFRSLICDALQNNNFETVEAANGEEGVEQAFQHRPDLIMCDIEMPILNGYRTLAVLRQNKATSNLPFIFVTGKDVKTYLRPSMELGADDFLTKPFTIEQLVAAINTRLHRHHELIERYEQQFLNIGLSISMSLPHELNTPLNGIIGFAELIQEEKDMTTDEVREMIGHVLLSARRLHRTLTNFLIYSQIEFLAGSPEKIEYLKKQRTQDIQQIIETVAKSKAETYRRKNDLRLNLTNGSLAISEEYFTRIFEELIDNAFKFSEAGSPVELAVTQQPGVLSLSLIDRGRGMTPDQISQIAAFMQFERHFYGQQGSGLGLIVAKRLTEIHGGEFLIKGIVGEGTNITFTIPRAQS
jgi:signal transduction histidine kinase